MRRLILGYSIVVLFALLLPDVTGAQSTSSAVFSRDLGIGMEGEDVRTLQKFLNTNGFTIAPSGVGSPGNETTFFGNRLEAALKRFQTARGIDATGYFGPETRAALSVRQMGSISPSQAQPTIEELLATLARLQLELSKLLTQRGESSVVSPSAQSTSSAVFSRDLGIGMEGEDVRTLQKFLNTNGFTIAPSGVGSPGNETTFFGNRLEAALKRFQTARGIDATGYFGPETRAALSGVQNPAMSSGNRSGGGGGSTVSKVPAQGSRGGSGGSVSSSLSSPTTTATGVQPADGGNVGVSSEVGSDTTAPTAPGNPIAIAVSSSQINLLWISSTDAVGVIGYRIYTDNNPVPIATVSASGVLGTYQVSELSPGTSYHFKIRAFDASGNTSLPAEVYATTKPGIGVGLIPDSTSPTKPRNVRTAAASETEVSLSWDSATDNMGVAGYRVYRGGKLVATLGTVTSHRDSGLKPGTSYAYTLEAFDDAGNASGQTAEVTVTTNAVPPETNVDPAPALYAKKVTPSPESLSTRYVQDLYQLVLNREPDTLGLRGHITNLASGKTYLDTMRAFVGSAEFIAMNAPASAYVDRLYSYMLGRAGDEPSRTTLIEMIEEGADRAEKMLEAYNIVAYSTEYTEQCPTSYHTYERKLKSGSPRLADIVSGAARFETIAKSDAVRLRFNSPGGPLWDQKMPIVKDPDSGDYYAVTRLHQPRYPGEFRYNLFLMRSTDGGVTFSEVGPIFDIGTGSDVFYDAHIAVDYSVCPNQYVMVYECKMGGLESFSTCVSRTTDITDPNTWTPPQVLIEGCDANPGRGCTSSKVSSASTPVIMIEGDKKYVAWAVVEQLDGWRVGRVYTRGMEITDFSRRAGYANQGTILMDSEVNSGNLATDSARTPWDWNNRNIADWRKEGAEYFMTYAGGNFFGCARESTLPPNISSTDSRAIVWGIGAGKSSRALALYSTPAEANIKADKFDSCAVTYNNISNIDGELYLYYSVNSAQAGIATLRSKLIWK